MHMNCPAAGIRLAITKFNPTAIATREASHFTDATVTLVGTAGNLVSQAAPNGPIRVDRGAVVDLVFEVIAADGSNDVYQPVGISFFGSDGTVGRLDFPLRTVHADPFNRLLLSVHDANIDANTFEYKVIIQRQRDGALGVIDPQVTNA
jgi:hypothetical protein